MKSLEAVVCVPCTCTLILSTHDERAGRYVSQRGSVLCPSIHTNNIVHNVNLSKMGYVRTGYSVPKS